MSPSGRITIVAAVVSLLAPTKKPPLVLLPPTAEYLPHSVVVGKII